MNRFLFFLGLSILFLSRTAAADPGDGRYGYHMWDGGGMFMGFGMMAIFLIAIIVVIVFLVRGLGGDSTPRASTATALEVLNERYARGEIDTEEYEERKKRISGNG